MTFQRGQSGAGAKVLTGNLMKPHVDGLAAGHQEICLQYTKYEGIFMTMSSRIPLTDQLRKIINESGMSRYAICKATGTDQGSMSRFMAGKSWLSRQSIDRIGELLGLSIVTAKKASRGKGR